jgi:DNA-binding transcriptional regulator YiaG
MDIDNAVYLVTDRQTTGAGVPAVIRGLYEKSARIAIEREEGTKIFDVPLWDLPTARAYTAAILRVCYSAWEALDRQGRSPGSLHEDDLVREHPRARRETIDPVIQDLASWRNKFGFSQRQATEYAQGYGFPLTASSLRMWEEGSRKPRAHTLALLRRFLEEHSSNPRP